MLEDDGEESLLQVLEVVDALHTDATENFGLLTLEQLQAVEVARVNVTNLFGDLVAPVVEVLGHIDVLPVLAEDDGLDDFGWSSDVMLAQVLHERVWVDVLDLAVQGCFDLLKE